MSSSPSLVSSLKDEQELKTKLSGAKTKLVVLEFVKPGSQLSSYVKKELENIAKVLQKKAEFYELDVDKFKKYAEKFKVEALPAFVVMQKFVKKRHVVGTDDLKKVIEDAYEKFQAENKQDDSSATNDSERKQDEANSSAPNTVVESGPNNGTDEPEKPAQTNSNSNNGCSIL